MILKSSTVRILPPKDVEEERSYGLSTVMMATAGMPPVVIIQEMPAECTRNLCAILFTKPYIKYLIWHVKRTK